jgi:hypothetical protein
MGLIRKTTGSFSKLTSLRMLKLNKAKYMYLKKRSKGVFAAELGIGQLPITHYLKCFIVAIKLDNSFNQDKS